MKAPGTGRRDARTTRDPNNAAPARHPVTAFFALTVVVSWGGLLAIAGPGGIPGAAADVERWFPIALMLLLVGPPVAATLLTGLMGGVTALRALGCRLRDGWMGAPWLAVALMATPAVVGVSLGASSYRDCVGTTGC